MPGARLALSHCPSRLNIFVRFVRPPPGTCNTFFRVTFLCFPNSFKSSGWFGAVAHQVPQNFPRFRIKVAHFKGFRFHKGSTKRSGSPRFHVKVSHLRDQVQKRFHIKGCSTLKRSQVPHQGVGSARFHTKVPHL